MEPHGISHVTPNIFLHVLSLLRRRGGRVLTGTPSGESRGSLEPLSLLRLSSALMTSSPTIPAFTNRAKVRPSHLPCPVMGGNYDATHGFTSLGPADLRRPLKETFVGVLQNRELLPCLTPSLSRRSCSSWSGSFTRKMFGFHGTRSALPVPSPGWEGVHDDATSGFTRVTACGFALESLRFLCREASTDKDCSI